MSFFSGYVGIPVYIPGILTSGKTQNSGTMSHFFIITLLVTLGTLVSIIVFIQYTLYKNNFIRTSRLKIAKNQEQTKNHSRLEIIGKKLAEISWF